MQRRKKSEVVEPLDPIALTLAMWLGLIVSVTGLFHLSEQMAERAAISKALTGAVDDGQAFNPQLIAFGS